MPTDKEIRAYLAEKGVPALVDQMMLACIEEMPENPAAFFRDFLTGDQPRAGPTKASAARPAARPVPGSRRQSTFINWAEISSKLPTGRDDASKKKRLEMFQGFDPNGNGYLSLAEVDKGLRDVVKLDAIFDCKPVILRAFQAARNANKSSRAALGDDFVTKSEFRYLLVYLRRYFELWIMFEDIDTNRDRRISFEEFKAALPKLESWGVRCYYPEQTFKVLDKDQGGMVLFSEFAEWGIRKQLDLEDDDDDDDEVFRPFKEGAGPSDGTEKVHPKKAADGAPKGPAQKAMKPTGPTKRTTAAKAKIEIDWAAISRKLPAGPSKIEKAKREDLFCLFDVNGNKYLSLAEVDKGLRDVLRLDAVFDCKPAIMRAFQASKDFDTKSRARLGKDFVTKSEFRVLLSYLRKYFELFVMFGRIDTDDDRRISVKEFTSAVELLTKWGIRVANPDKEFRKLDKNGGGQILFDEFCDWAIPKGLDLEDDDD